MPLKTADLTLNSIDLSGTNAATGSIGITYDKDERVVGAGAESIGYDPHNGTISSTSLGVVQSAATYDQFGQILNDQYKAGKELIFATDFKRDSLGRISQKTEKSAKHSSLSYDYSYDSLGRLVETKIDGISASHYEYDANGNRVRTTHPFDSVDARYDDQDRLISSGASNYSYSVNGELESKTDSFGSKTSYTYDSFGNLKEVHKKDREIEYLVDGFNRRVAKKVQGQLVHGYIWQTSTQLLAETDSKGKITRRFVYGTKANSPDYMITDKHVFRIISDQLGSPRLLVDTKTGKPVEQMFYDDFGQRLDVGEDPLPIGFAGGLYDHDTGLLRFGARDYDPEIGRWLSKDPILFGGHQANLYSYSFNDPINWLDPSGTDAFADSPGGGGEPAEIPSPSSGGTVYVAPNGQAILVPEGTTMNPASNGNGTVYNIPGGTQIRLMGPTQLSPNGYGKINVNGTFFDSSGNAVPRNSPEAHIQPTNCGGQ